MYAAGSREADRQITSYTWAQGIQTDVIPHYYVIAQCPECYFADFKESFENPTSGKKETVQFEAKRNLDFKRVLILKKLRRLVPPEGNINLEGAISLHLSALFITLLPAKEEDIDHNKLGRLFLRLSWLYKELKGDLPADAEEKPENVSVTVEKLYKNIEALQGNWQTFSDELGNTSTYIRERAKELSIPEEGEKNPYFPLVQALEDKLKETHTLLEMLFQRVISDKKGNLPVSGAATGKPAGNIDQLLTEISGKWPGIPYSEEACIRSAIAAFDYSSRYEDTDQSIEQMLSMVNLIVKLLLKIKDLDGALNYIQQIFKNGSRDKQELQRRLNQGKQDKTLNEFDERNLLRKIATVNNTLSQAGETRRQILGLIYEKNKDKIIPLLKANIEKSPGEQCSAILNAGFTEDLIPFLRERGLMKNEETKKGLFGKNKK